jgi:hypothetical protein
MSGQPAVSGAPALRVLLVDADHQHDVFEVIDMADGIVRARSPFLFEVGEELRLRIERNGDAQEVTARVRAHVGDDKITELELLP